MSTVFMVTRGQCSDYSVDGIFSTREKAEEFIQQVPDSDCNGITEMTLDPGITEIRNGMTVFIVRMLRNGDTESVEPVGDDMSRYTVSNVGMHVWQRSKVRSPTIANQPDCLHGTVWARDEKHAVKIANEKRTRMIATGEWP